ncbi:HAD hydrolase family protein [Bacillus sp. ISL-7]|nr:HAD hydrolase family protein [Bacillus sp. ISL-7]
MTKPIVFFDIDGTLLDEDKVILDSTKKAVRVPKMITTTCSNQI